MGNTKKGGIVITIVIIVILAIGIGCYFGYDKFFNKKTNTNEEIKETQDSNPDEDNTIKEIEIDSDIVQTAMGLLNNLYITEESLYSNNKYNISEISNYDMIATAIRNIDTNFVVSACVNDKERRVIPYDTLNTALNKYVLDKTIDESTIKSLTEGSSYVGVQYEVVDTGINLKEGGVELYGTCSWAFQPRDFVKKKVIKAEKNNEYLYIYQKEAFAKYSDSDTQNYTLVNYYKDYNKTKLVEKDLDSYERTDDDGNITNNSTPNWDKYNTYKYTFKIVNTDYYLQSVELMK